MKWIKTYVYCMEIKRTHDELFDIFRSFKSNEKFSKIRSRKVYDYEANSIPSWEDAFTKWDKNGRMY